jgi:hypothetical protein
MVQVIWRTASLLTLHLPTDGTPFKKNKNDETAR